ncbi:MAG TPA: VOC family protein, partial [Rhodanobacteraceae bacterium]|nr:VOC family protein [Rhodanobacteraceae bacterium]
MARVIGLGGIFFKARDPKVLAAWYAQHLGLKIERFGGAKFAEDAARPGYALWMPFAKDTKYFEPSDKPLMVN